MSWWGNADGSEKNAFVSGFEPIPEGTEAMAEVTKACLIESPGYDPRYEINWKIFGDKFNNRVVFQKIKCFDGDLMRSEKAKNMLMLLFKLFDLPAPENAPTDFDLMKFQGKTALIKIGYWKQNDKDGNFVREVHPSDSESTSPSAQAGDLDVPF